MSKVNRYAASRAARSIVGQARSTLDPSSWLRSGAIVVVNTAKGTVGEDTAALIGGTVINLVSLLIGEQARLADAERRPATLIIDEFHTIPGADYEGILSELAKYGASLILATQSLARLESLDRDRGRSLRATVFANLDGLFAFNTSAEDARYLIRELGGEIDEHDLVELGEHQCYAKLSAGGERLPTFSVSLDPPPPSDPTARTRIAEQSAARYGRDAHAVERDLGSALARIEKMRKTLPGGETSGNGGDGASTPSKLPHEVTSSTKNVNVRGKNPAHQQKHEIPLQATRLNGRHHAERADEHPALPDESALDSGADESDGEPR